MEQLRVPPNDIEAERSLLGSILIRPKALLEIVTFIKPESFYELKNQDIYRTMLELTKRSEPIDLVSLTTKLRESNKLESVGGIGHLNDLVTMVPVSTNVEHYAKIVADKAMMRQLIDVGYQIIDSGYETGIEPNKVVEMAGTKVLGINTGVEKEDTDILSSFQQFDMIQKEFLNKQFDETNKYIGIPTGFEKIDSAVDGLRKGHLWIIGGYTSTGKTWFSLNIINNIMMENPTTFFSLEMSKADIVARLLAIQSGIGSTKIQRHEFDEIGEVDKYAKAKERLLQSKLKVYASLKMSLDELVLSMTRDIIKNKTKVFVIDYIQQIKVGSKEEYAALNEIATTLQAFALKTNTTIIALSQISNEGAKEQSKEYMSFKGSGAIGASADLAIQLFNKDKKEDRIANVKAGKPLTVTATVMKNRHGRIGETTLDFTPWNGQFTSSIWDD